MNNNYEKIDRRQRERRQMGERRTEVRAESRERRTRERRTGWQKALLWLKEFFGFKDSE